MISLRALRSISFEIQYTLIIMSVVTLTVNILSQCTHKIFKILFEKVKIESERHTPNNAERLNAKECA